jgi:hypothetical protein
LVDVVRETGRSHGAFVVGWGRGWRVRRRALGRMVNVARHSRGGEARICAGECQAV